MNSLAILNALLALLMAWTVSMILGYIYIKVTYKYGFNQPINPDVPKAHLQKVGTPTAGGIFFIIGITVSVIVLGDITHPYTFIPLVTMWSFALVGFFDDATKIARKESIGLRTSRKLAMQILVAALILWLQSSISGLQTTVISHPWIPSRTWNIGLWYPIAFLFYMVTFVNAVNITDGLDGLATQVAISPLILLAIIAGLFGSGLHFELIQGPINNGGLNLLVVLTATLGGLFGFLWYNGPKAQVFMGDTGSHALGAVLAICALLMKVELIVLVASLVFLLECFSSFIQIISIRIFGKKVFAMAPFHHHLEKKEVTESKIVIRLQIVSIIASVLAGIFFIIKYL